MSESSIVPGIPKKRFTIGIEFEPAEYAFPHIPPFLKPREMVRALQSTSTKTHTRTSQMINRLDDETVRLELVHLKTSASLWRNLMHYADPTRCLPGRDFDRNTLGVTADGKTEASSVDAALGVMTMDAAARFLDVWTPPREIVNSQQTVRDSAFDFVAKFTLYAIMQRYANAVMVPDPNDANPQCLLGWRGNIPSQDQSLNVAQMVAKPTLAGQADGILQSGLENNRDTNCILTTKPYWSYNAETLDKIFSGQVIDNEEETFDWNESGVEHNLLRQFWGSLVIMECNFGIWTNGNEVFLAVRTAPQTLVLTDRHDWAENETTKAIIGLTYAAIDEKRWVAKGVNNIREQLVGQTEVIGQVQDSDGEDSD